MFTLITIVLVSVSSLSSPPVEICRFQYSPVEENLTILVQDVVKALDIKKEFMITKLCKKTKVDK